MDLVTMAMCTPKVIDLDKYRVGDASSTTTIGTVILYAFQQAAAGGFGFSGHLKDTAFWDDLNTKRPLRIVINTQMMGVDGKVQIDGGTLLVRKGKVEQLTFSFELTYEVSVMMQVMIARAGENVIVKASVFPITYPDAV